MDSFRTELLPEEQPAEPKKNPVLNFLWEIVQTVVMAMILYFLVDMMIGRVQVENISMEPTLQPGERLIVNKLAYRLGSIKRGDVIVFHYPRNPNSDYIKRVIGLPGETVRIADGTVYINNEPLQEDYIAAPATYFGEWTVPEGQVFVLGDNRNQSFDSHSWGFVPKEMIVGKAILIYWPPSAIRVLNQTPLVNAAGQP
ncbi:signal peptidase I [Anaerolinea thermophila]|uniref:Signal peptidase I n=1 Tax=Anaerolinea thermophila (strain DSM 14523 / JCM 11388 / NBRC 100420 / UNI-1) TaxID=926569 RepID=E8N685_ANATU|nr:signal peptidase I [Anaerolinea thermophila]BAJ63949.1 signal peptidase I [Anaerolinea thermophila UNI-1]